MFEIKNNEKNKSAVILNPERSEWVSISQVTSVESVVNDGAKTKPHHALRRSLRALAYGSTLKMTALAFLLFINISESWAAIKCVFSNNGQTVTITGGESDSVPNPACTESNSSSEEEGWSYNSKWKSTITSANIGTGVTSIGTNAFQNAGSLTSITIPDSVTSIGQNAFQGASSLTSITIPDSVTSIGENAFWNASSLESITLPDSVTSIGNGAFFGASSLTSITIPKGVTSIGNNAFNGASSLTSITLPDSLTSIGQNAFRNASSLTSITIPEGVTSIGASVFNGASSLTSITLPDSVTSIGNYAFSGTSSLTSITIPDSVTGIGQYAFVGASSLTEIIIPDSLTAEQITKLKNASLKSGLTVYCQGDTKTCKAALDAAGYSNAKVKQADSTRCSGKYIYDTTCRQRNENECNSVAKYYYNTTNNQCQLLPKTESACTGANIEWTTDKKCVNKNYTPQQEANNSDTGGDDIGDISGDFNPADCYNKGQVPYDNKCWDEYPFAKKRWTPAEASQWLHDGNDNFVVITFKK